MQQPDIEDDFSGPLRADLWVDHYLPHWTTPERSAARYSFQTEGMQLRIDLEQLNWRDEDAPLRVSNLQTGTFAGDLGTRVGTHRHREDGLVVRSPTPTRLLWAPTAGRVELTVSASVDPQCMLAAWLVGTEHLDAAHSGEVCIFEIDGHAVGASTLARSGIKAHTDSAIETDMADVCLPFDASKPHTWSVDWGENRTVICCENIVVRDIPQAPNYPTFLMIDLFEIGQPSGAYPKTAMLHSFRGWTR
ncbi:hypothetical protein FHX48_000545 [Microbacterium halimionae]|uniref:Glycosyl hydrolases family 16 n=1 Tax=Microbacterium halimionae TaxID=1526413 RepID=A0A7W3JMF0_9MICO|nr:hypothetical protein [Microbacterium halimionae]MBA8815493.1 hypothetical protein [Microbacterium halimionae]NII95540.1 hypothetical protein [Microbacterium halimionae]